MVQTGICIPALSLLETDSTVCDELEVGIQSYVYTSIK
jgi:hypothetical protein